ncbi:MAG: NUDIX domain-containing protein [Candidatus Eisenbacteria bacterium]|uniref:NUDIX domain-containing protein n=1 Tax=Eiseniibacteriota bacterium TaxID=2212470 RepID=A0A538SLF7_UNCEI|nr:MAG: NUDIX domain-containing protein [Candidatus Eisenbacteria bacterium]
MPKLVCTKVEVYIFRRRRGRVEILALRRAPNRRLLPGVWQPVTAKIEAGERALDCAFREVVEETGITPRRLWAIGTVTVYFDGAADTVNALPLFAAEVDPKASVTLSREHDASAFVSPREAGRRFLWESQRRGLEVLGREVLRGGALARALEVSHLMARRTADRRRDAAAGRPGPAR